MVRTSSETRSTWWSKTDETDVACKSIDIQ
jgi:hypothetical protein